MKTYQKATLGGHLSGPKTQSKQSAAPKANVLAWVPPCEDEEGSQNNFQIHEKSVPNSDLSCTPFSHAFQINFWHQKASQNLTVSKRLYLRGDDLLHRPFVQQTHPKNELKPVTTRHWKQGFLLLFAEVLKTSPSRNKCQNSHLKPHEACWFSSQKRVTKPLKKTEGKQNVTCQQA